MTYIDYLNTFHQWCESNTLPANSRLLYIDLLHVFNRAGWPEHVRVDTPRLMGMIGASDKRAVYRARDALVEAGLIAYQKGKKGNPGTFRLCTLGAKNGTENSTTNGTKNSTETGTENGTHIKTKTKTKTKTDLSIPDGIDCRTDVQRVVAAWNSLGLSKVERLMPDTERYKMLKCRLRDYGLEAILKAIEHVRTSDFLLGRAGNKPFVITFDWFVKPNNFPKVLDGNYNNNYNNEGKKECSSDSNGQTSRWNLAAIDL